MKNTSIYALNLFLEYEINYGKKKQIHSFFIFFYMLSHTNLPLPVTRMCSSFQY